VTRKEDMKVDRGQGSLSRRAFLKCSGTIILVMGGGLYALAEGNGTAEGRDPLAASDGYLLVDVEKCQGCASCMLACSLVHEGVQSQSLSRIQILQSSFDAFPNDLEMAQCRQCIEPACVDVCPEGALTADAGFGNVRRVDPTKCIGCGACQEACPYRPSRSALAPDENFNGEDKAYKCDLCAVTPYHWDDAGGGPKGKQACVEVCPVEAIRFTKEIPIQDGAKGYKIDLRDAAWQRLGYPHQ
jgi:protein NrfC